ncbi:hypothetical protein [Curtobacterium sp. Leaf261]|uniref:hypothetical protein n=1 Tax=Curtobacterium sp. Leaf261 TaxID=1736311 RepID=UPI000700D6FF|nr:hypothetical protein [Curtobacterium sp. Leaf261]KQO63011.1 hypothetical protein ASF23_09010 [Curtobacterium sp. Leaf261]
MQLGTRWSVGQAAPSDLPATVVDAVRQVEAELSRDGVDASTWRWTLTWLERKPVVELDDGTAIRLDARGEAAITNPDDAPEED